MKTETIVKNLNSAFDEASRCARKRDKMLKSLFKEIKAVEKGLFKQLSKESQKGRKKKLKKKLGMVKSAYASLR